MATIGSKRLVCRLVITSSTKYFVDAGRIKPDDRLIIISTKPNAMIPRRDRSSARTCGRSFQSNFAFAGFSAAPGFFSMAIEFENEALAFRCQTLAEDSTLAFSVQRRAQTGRSRQMSPRLTKTIFLIL